MGQTISIEQYEEFKKLQVELPAVVEAYKQVRDKVRSAGEETKAPKVLDSAEKLDVMVVTATSRVDALLETINQGIKDYEEIAARTGQIV